MRFTASLEHRTFFSKNRYLECGELFSEEQVSALSQQIEGALTRKLKTKGRDATPSELFQEGYDLWRDNPEIKKVVLKNSLAHIAAALFKTHCLRIAYDLYLSSDGTEAPLTNILSIAQISCVKPIAGACLIRLSNEPIGQTVDQAQCPIPSQAGHVVFLSPDFLLHWDQVFALKQLKCLLIVYAPKQAIYHLDPKDPHTHVFKRLGYVFGDRLDDTLNPIIYRD